MMAALNTLILVLRVIFRFFHRHHLSLSKADRALPILAKTSAEAAILDAEKREPRYLNSSTCSIDSPAAARVICELSVVMHLVFLGVDTQAQLSSPFTNDVEQLLGACF